MSREQALAFFDAFFCGRHHWAERNLRGHGGGWSLCTWKNLSTYDGNDLTRLVMLAHDLCVRVTVEPASPRHIRITLFQRTVREGGHFYERHPTIETAVSEWRKRNPVTP